MNVVCALIIQNKKVLLAQRPLYKSHGGKWEFPGGKSQSSESLEQALERELQEELTLSIQSTEKLGSVTSETIQLFSFLAQPSRAYLPREHRAIAWAELDQVEKFDLADLDRKTIVNFKKQIKKYIENSAK